MVLSKFTSICCIDFEICNSGSDGVRTDNYEIMGFSLLSLHERQEILDPIFAPQSFRFKGLNSPLSRYSTPSTHIPHDKWQEIAYRKVNGESLRQIALSYNVSYETIRQVLLRARADDEPLWKSPAITDAE